MLPYTFRPRHRRHEFSRPSVPQERAQIAASVHPASSQHQLMSRRVPQKRMAPLQQQLMSMMPTRALQMQEGQGDEVKKYDPPALPPSQIPTHPQSIQRQGPTTAWTEAAPYSSASPETNPHATPACAFGLSARTKPAASEDNENVIGPGYRHLFVVICLMQKQSYFQGKSQCFLHYLNDQNEYSRLYLCSSCSKNLQPFLRSSHFIVT